MTEIDCYSHKQLSPISKLVYLYFRHKYKDADFSMTLSEIAQALSLTKNTVYRAIQPLEDWGFIAHEQSGSSPTKYHLL